MIICGGRNIVVDALMYSDSVLIQFSNNELLISQVGYISNAVVK